MKWTKGFGKRRGVLIVGLAVILALVASQVGVIVNPTQDEARVAFLTVGQHNVVLTVGTLAHAAGEVDYTCDGVDDHVQIQAAIDALPAGGGKVMLLGGTFSVTSAITIEKSNVLIEGVGKATIIDLASVAIDGFVFGDGSTARRRCGIRDLWITSSVTKNAGSAIKFNKIYFGYATDFYLDNQFFGVSVQGDSIIIRIDRFEIVDCISGSGIGIRLVSGTATKNVDIFISNGNISAPLGSESLVGIRIQNAGGVYLSDIDITYQQFGLLIDPSGAGDYVEAVFASQILVDTCTNNGFSINPGAGKTTRTILLTNCWASTDSVGVYIGQSQTGTIDSVWLRGLTAVNNQNQGVVFNYGTNLFLVNSDISGNSVASANADDGVVVAAGISEWSIWSSRMGNHIVGAGTQRYGIYIIAGNSDNYTVMGNDLRENGTGSMLDGGTGTNKIVRDNLAYITENSGIATLLNTNTTVIVTHGCSITPTVIQITFTENPDNVLGDWWVDTVGAASFTFNGVDPGASNLDFYWEAKVR